MLFNDCGVWLPWIRSLGGTLNHIDTTCRNQFRITTAHTNLIGLLLRCRRNPHLLVECENGSPLTYFCILQRLDKLYTTCGFQMISNVSEDVRAKDDWNAVFSTCHRPISRIQGLDTYGPVQIHLAQHSPRRESPAHLLQKCG